MSDDENSNPNNFKIGDVVRLRSGGPALTIVYVGKVSAECVWWDQGCAKGVIPLTSLVAAEPDVRSMFTAPPAEAVNKLLAELHEQASEQLAAAVQDFRTQELR